jgi:sulfur carrier protein ThiS
MRSRILLAALAVTGCSYFQSGTATAPTPDATTKPTASKRPGAGAGITVTTSSGLLKAMHDRYSGKYLKTMSFLQNNTAYTTTGEERKSQWYEHLAIPGKLRIAFLPASSKSGLVQVDDKVASFDNGIRVDFRPSVNPLLLLTADVYVAPVATIMHGLDSLHVDGEIVRNDQWQGEPVYVVGANAGDSTSNQYWVDRNNLRLVRFIQRQKAGERTIVSDIRVQGYKEIDGFDVPTEFLVLRNGRPVWREQYADVRINEDFPAGTFDQARWNDIPIPK